MRFLFTTEFYYPLRGGAEEVVRQIAERLVKRGHEVTVATSFVPYRTSAVINGVHIRQFKVAGNAVKGIRGEVSEYQSFVSSYDGDLLFNYAAQIWTTDLVFDILDSLKVKKVLAPLGYSKLKHPSYRRYFDQLPRFLSKYDKLIYTSEGYQDKIFGDAHGLSEKAIIIPNGAAEEEFLQPPLGFRKQYGICTPYMVLNVSNHYWSKGHLFAIEAFKRMRRNDVTLVIIGELPQRHPWHSCYPICKALSKADRRIKVLRKVPREWVVSAYKEADIFLFSSKVECAPLVMYESFASKTAFVTTHVGNVKDHSDIVIIVGSPDEMARAANKLLDDHSARESLASRAYALWHAEHRWEYIIEKYEKLFCDIVQSTT